MVCADDSGSINYREKHSFQSQISIELVLTTGCLLIFMKQGDFKCSLQLSSILGASRASSSNEMIVSQYEDISNLRSGCFQSCTYKERGSDRVKRKHMFFFKTKESCTEWTDRINASLGIIAGKRRKFLVILNPVSGPGRSQYFFDNIVKVMLEEAHIDPTLVVTERQHHAFYLMSDACFGISQYSVIMVIGGDGLLFEVINGLARRPNGKQILQDIPIAPIPGGSGNGLAKACSSKVATNTLAYNLDLRGGEGVPAALDLSVIHTKSDPMYSFLSTSWGLVSDVDIDLSL